MSIAPSIPVNNMAPTDPRTDLDSSSTSPPITPPTRSSGPDAGSVSLGLPSPPPSSSSKRLTNNQQDLDQSLHHHTNLDDESTGYNTPRQPDTLTSNPDQTTIKTHSSSSSTSSSASNHQLPTNLTNKHIAVAKTKILGHLARSTSSEVDSEVANALASGRSIVSKTDWKDEDAQYLVQLIETQFPKGNIIWDWVGQQMASRGFTKSQCRSKWKRIRTKVLHGNDPPNKDRDSKDHYREQEHDELNEEDEDNMGDRRSMVMEPRTRYEYDYPHERSGYSDPLRQRHRESRDYYDQDDHYRSDRKEAFRSQYSPIPPSTHPHRNSTSHHSTRHVSGRGAEEDDIWSDDDRNSRPSHDMTGKRYSQDYYSRPSPPRAQSYHHRRQSSSFQSRDDVLEESVRSIAAIASTPTSFGKIEWKPEDSDYLVHLIESKFASRKVDWAWVSKQMEGRGYDRTQCKSRWWRVQHRQNQNNQQNLSISQAKQDQSPIQVSNNTDPNSAASSRNDKDNLSDEEISRDARQHSPKHGLMTDQESPSAQSGVQSMLIDEIEPNHQQSSEIQGDDESRNESRGLSKAQEHQKHIEWKEEDSQYMYQLIEKEFPVGNVVWNVIGEKMQGRGYSQTQCMSKWRRHLKNIKTPNDASKSGISMDLDTDVDTISRRRGADDHANFNDTSNEGSKRFRRDGADTIRYDKNGEYKVIDPLNARLVEMEYDRYYDAGGKRKRIDDKGFLESDAPYRNRSHSRSRDDYHSYDNQSGFGGERHNSASMYEQERGRSNGRNGDIHQSSSAADSQPWRDDYGSKYPGHKSHHHHRSSSVSSSHRHSYSHTEHPLDQSRDSPRQRNPDHERLSSRRSPDYESSRGVREDYRGNNLAVDRQSRSTYEYDDYDRRRSRHSQRTRYDDRGEMDYIDYALEDEMDWAAGRWESRDMARLAAAVAKQGRRWDAIRAQIKIPTLVTQYDDIDSDIYDGPQFDSHPSTYPYYQKETRRSRSHQKSYSSLRDPRDTRQQPHSSASRYESSREPKQTTKHDFLEKLPQSIKQPSLHHTPIAGDSPEVNRSENTTEDEPMGNPDHPYKPDGTEDTTAGSASVRGDNGNITEPKNESESVTEIKEQEHNANVESHGGQTNQAMEDVTIEDNPVDK
ncbi:hypothetical protein BGZ76_003309 [Entomortierella beljakovae]|nr:hypothetical protein BGZ76_003309 [Entomortierella beljakovae]